MEPSNYDNYGKNEPTIYRPPVEPGANTLGALVVNFVIFESIFSGFGALGGSSVLGAPESFAHTTAELAGVNNIASAGYDREIA